MFCYDFSLQSNTFAGDVIVGVEALRPEYRHNGTVIRPLLPITPGAERYTMHKDVMRCVLHKVFEDLNITPGNYHVWSFLIFFL